MEQKVVIFIDGSNLYHALRENFGRTDVNFAEFAHKLAGDRPLFRIYYYNILQDAVRNPDGSRDQAEFLTMLRNTPYVEVRLGGLKYSQGVTVEKGVDVMVATDLLQFACDGVYDVAILVSGDSDFTYALQAVKNRGKQVEVANFESNVSRDLLEVADTRHLLDKAFFQTLWSGSSRRRAAPSGRRRRSRARPGAAVADGNVPS